MGITGVTNNKLFTILTYDNDNPYQVGKNGVTSVTNQTLFGENYKVVKYNLDDILYTTYISEDKLDLFNIPLTDVTGSRQIYKYTKVKNNTALRVNESDNQKLLRINSKQISGSKFSTNKISKERPTTNTPSKRRSVNEIDRLSFLNFLGDTTFEVNDYSYNQFVDKKIIKEEKYVGLIDTPKVKSDIFMERDFIPVMERHQRMADINSINELELYKNGYFKMIKTA
jgi:hypothetical protein